jgi:hypothetical protein
MTLDDVLDAGFDRSKQYDEDDYVTVRCSGCDALVINGTPCHETGCPNGRRAAAVEEEEEVEYAWCTPDDTEEEAN